MPFSYLIWRRKKQCVALLEKVFVDKYPEHGQILGSLNLDIYRVNSRLREATVEGGGKREQEIELRLRSSLRRGTAMLHGWGHISLMEQPWRLTGLNLKPDGGAFSGATYLLFTSIESKNSEQHCSSQVTEETLKMWRWILYTVSSRCCGCFLSTQYSWETPVARRVQLRVLRRMEASAQPADCKVTCGQ